VLITREKDGCYGFCALSLSRSLSRDADQSTGRSVTIRLLHVFATPVLRVSILLRSRYA
jgi:hypothetical protein